MKRFWLLIFRLHNAAIAIGRWMAGLARTATNFFSGPFVKAMEEREFCFPRDHGRQPAFQTEWWHLVGNLESEDGRPWGYQFTIFRHRPALWVGRRTALRAPFDLYMAHTAITNIAEGKFAASMCLGGPFMQRAAAEERRLHVRVGECRLEDVGGCLRIQAESCDWGIQLELFPRKPPILSAGNGLLPESAYHYFMTSLPTTGNLRWRGTLWTVHGKSWMDREFGSHMVPQWLEGWDWFALMLDDDSAIVLAIGRGSDGTRVRSYCSVISPDGDPSHLEGNGNFYVRPLEYWTSPLTGATYPVRWDAVIPSIDCQLTIAPAMREHEMVLSSRLVAIDYWEGPVKVTGTRAGKAVTGNGYGEMTGYREPVAGKF